MYEVPVDGDPSRSYKTRNALLSDGEVLFEGMILRRLEGRIEEGDTYIGQRNTGPHLLTCRKVDIGAVFPMESAYAFDIGECVKVEVIL